MNDTHQKIQELPLPPHMKPDSDYRNGEWVVAYDQRTSPNRAERRRILRNLRTNHRKVERKETRDAKRRNS